MSVCLATQTLSHTVSSGIMTLVGLNKMSGDSKHTENFIKFLMIFLIHLIVLHKVNQNF